MENRYSAQNVAAYFIYEFNENNLFINREILQKLLLDLEVEWKNFFGHSAYLEEVTSIKEKGYAVKEVHEKYAELQDKHIEHPAKDWYLKFGEFQLVYRPYGIPPFTVVEEQLAKKVVHNYRKKIFKKVS